MVAPATGAKRVVGLVAEAITGRIAGCPCFEPVLRETKVPAQDRDSNVARNFTSPEVQDVLDSSSSPQQHQDEGREV